MWSLFANIATPGAFNADVRTAEAEVGKTIESPPATPLNESLVQKDETEDILYEVKVRRCVDKRTGTRSV
jgi:hypothetical protein